MPRIEFDPELACHVCRAPSIAYVGTAGYVCHTCGELEADWAPDARRDRIKRATEAGFPDEGERILRLAAWLLTHAGAPLPR